MASIDFFSFSGMNYCQVRQEIVHIFDPNDYKNVVYEQVYGDVDYQAYVDRVNAETESDDDDASDVDIDFPVSRYEHDNNDFVNKEYDIDDEIVNKLIEKTKDSLAGVDLGADEQKLIDLLDTPRDQLDEAFEQLDLEHKEEIKEALV